VLAPTDNPAWPTDLLYGDRFIFGSSGLAAAAGYPIVQVPAGNVFGIPLGISFLGTAFSEPKLIKLASGFEAVTRERAKNPPTFALMLPDENISGTKIKKPKAQKQRRGGEEADAAAAPSVIACKTVRWHRTPPHSRVPQLPRVGAQIDPPACPSRARVLPLLSTAHAG
jgi:hypothetical protein